MKNIDKLNRLLSALLIITITLFLGSCKKEGCTDPNASNYQSSARIDDGFCRYEGCTNPDAENYDIYAQEEDQSCTFARDKFIGTYFVDDVCNSGFYDYTITIIPAADFKKVIIGNIAGMETVANIEATIYGNVITFNNTANISDFEGGGSLVGNELSISYSITTDGVVDNCSAVGTRQ